MNSKFITPGSNCILVNSNSNNVGFGRHKSSQPNQLLKDDMDARICIITTLASKPYLMSKYFESKASFCRVGGKPVFPLRQNSPFIEDILVLVKVTYLCIAVIEEDYSNFTAPPDQFSCFRRMLGERRDITRTLLRSTCKFAQNIPFEFTANFVPSVNSAVVGDVNGRNLLSETYNGDCKCADVTTEMLFMLNKCYALRAKTFITFMRSIIEDYWKRLEDRSVDVPIVEHGYPTDDPFRVIFPRAMKRDFENLSVYHQNLRH